MFESYEIQDARLMICRLKGILDARSAERVVEFIEIKEVEIENGFHRFCDMTLLEGIQLSFMELLGVAERRAVFNPNDIHVKSAFFAIHPVAFGIASMYQHFLTSPRIELRVFEDLEAAAEWLAVSPDILKL